MLYHVVRTRFGFFLFFLILAIALVYLLRWQVDTVITDSEQQLHNRDTLLAQAINLQKAYQRMVALGFDPHTIHYTVPNPNAETKNNVDQSDPNILGRHRMGKLYTPPAAYMALNQGAWQLGGGQIIGQTTEKPDVAFFLVGLTLEACKAINTLLWQDEQSAKPSVSATSLQDWQQQKAVINTLFEPTGRSESCIQLQDGQYLYYRVVYQMVRG